jgi:hypothetical protein
MIVETARRPLWVATAGLLLGIAGFVWDTIWHSRHSGMEMTGLREVLEAHSLMLIAVAIMVAAFASAVRVVHGPRTAVLSTRAAFVGSLSMAVGFAWDSVRHVQGTESATAHSMIYAGLVVVAIGLTAALVVTRPEASSQRRVHG